MTTRRAEALLSTIRDWASRRGDCEASDQELLERFIRSREQTAFATLVARHGPRVLGVCRRVLRDEHAAEDAFQNVFLLLARKAGSIHERTLLAGWLYGTACRTAAHARADAARRRGREALAEAGRPSGDPAVEAVARELSAVLDEEVGHLPERYRSPIILCHVEGQTRDEAARRLGCSPRTLQRHLERGRALLRARLGRRGVTLSAALIAPTLWGRPVEAAVSARLASAAVQAAVAAPSITAFSSLVGATAGRAVRLFLLTRTQVALGLLAIGPFVMRHLFGQVYPYSRYGLAVVGLGMGFHLAAGTLNQAALARDRARPAAGCWALAAVAFVAWMLAGVVPGQVLRTELGYAGATLLLAGVLALLYRRSAPASAPRLA